jgi:dCTP deaminase
VILTDREIQISIQQGLIIIQPQPASDVFFSSTALDLTLDSHIRTFNDGVIGVDKTIDPSNKGTNSDQIIKEITTPSVIPDEGYLLTTGRLILGWTVEYVKLDLKARIAARVEGKSSLARLGLGVHVTAPTIHAGFEGQIQLEIINHGSIPIRLRPNMRICQLIFETTTGTPVKGYDGQFLGQTADTPKPATPKKKK